MKFFRHNSLTIVFFGLFVLAMIGQFVTGLDVYNEERRDEHQPSVSAVAYLGSGHFIETTFENWESEFLQMALFVVLTISLKQKGSSESKKFDEQEDVDREPDASRAGAPWPVRKGGWILTLYKNSLTLAFVLLFLASFMLHLYGSLKDENYQNAVRGKPLATLGQFMLEPRFWFESFQNWQSEFLSVFSVVLLSIFLRQKGSPQSKPVDAPDSETGE